MKAEQDSSARTPAEVARDAFEAVAAGDADRIVEFGHPDRYVDEFVAIGTYRGKDEVRAFFQEMFTAFPDHHLEVLNIVGDDRMACVQWRITATHTGGPFLGLAPSGRRIDLKGVDVMEIEDGYIAHNTIYYDGATFARQVGLLPKDGSVMDSAIKKSFNAKTRAVGRLRR